MDYFDKKVVTRSFPTGRRPIGSLTMRSLRTLTQDEHAVFTLSKFPEAGHVEGSFGESISPVARHVRNDYYHYPN